MQREIGIFVTPEQIDLLMQALDQLSLDTIGEEMYSVDNLIELIEHADARVNKI